MTKALTVYFTSDTHGYILPTDFMTRTQKPMGLACIAPMLRRDGNTLLIDGGDTLQGSPLTFFCHKEGIPSPVAACINRMGYDYITPGNHDFNYGWAHLQRYLNDVTAKCLCANVHDAQGRLPLCPSDVRVLANGLRVGLIGAMTSFVPVWERPAHIEGITFSDALAAMRQEAERLHPQVDILIGIYHGGFEKDLATGKLLSDTEENIACRLCEQLPLDILLTGHQHIALADTVYSGTHIVQTPANARAYVELTAEWCSEGLQIQSALRTPGDEPDAEIMRLLAPIDTPLQAWLDQPAGHLPYDLLPTDKATMAAEGSAIADFFNQVQLAESGAQVSCTSLANDVKGLLRNATVRDVVSTYVYPNTLVTLEVTGKVLKEALERCASYLELDADGKLRISDAFLKPKVEHYNYDYFMGIAYAFDIRRPVGDRVVQMDYDTVPITPEQTLTLCLNSYRASGAGGYDMLKPCPQVREGTQDISEMLLEYMARHDPVEIQRAAFRAITE